MLANPGDGVRVDWAIPCRYVEVQQAGGATIVGAGADLATVQSTPAAVPVLFAVRLVGAPDEFDGKTPHELACRIYGPDGQQVGEQTARLTSQIDQRVPGYVAEILLPLGVVLDVQGVGTFGVEFSVDDHSLRVPIHVVTPV